MHSLSNHANERPSFVAGTFVLQLSEMMPRSASSCRLRFFAVPRDRRLNPPCIHRLNRLTHSDGHAPPVLSVGMIDPSPSLGPFTFCRIRAACVLTQS